MEHLDFILWMILFPISVSVSGYIDALKDKAKGKIKEYDKETKGKAWVLIFLIYLIIAIILY